MEGKSGSKITVRFVGAVLTAFCFLTLLPITPGFSAFALSISLSFGGGGGGGIADALCTVVLWFTEDGIGRAIASLSVIFLGIQAFFGKVTWGTAIMYAAGIMAIFGADEIVDAVTGGLGGGGC